HPPRSTLFPYTTLFRSQGRGKIYLLGAFIIIVVVGVTLYVYASSQSTPAVLYAKLVTSQGQIEIELYQNATPKTVTNFVNLARSDRKSTRLNSSHDQIS